VEFGGKMWQRIWALDRSLFIPLYCLIAKKGSFRLSFLSLKSPLTICEVTLQFFAVNPISYWILKVFFSSQEEEKHSKLFESLSAIVR